MHQFYGGLWCRIARIHMLPVKRGSCAALRSPLFTSLKVSFPMPMTLMLKRVADSILRRATVRQREAALDRLLNQGSPSMLTEPARYLLREKANPCVQAVQYRVENRRHQIASKGTEPVKILYSPKPGTAGSEIAPNLRPEHGEIMSFTMERVARTGKDKRWGTFLHLLACEVKGTFLELGSCAGISSSYLAISPSCERLITIEGSAALARLARETTGSVAPGRVELITGLFDDVLDTLIPSLADGGINFAFIDGHHE